MAQLVADTSRNCFPLSRAEDSVNGLRQRVLHHIEQEDRLGRLYQICQQSWSTQHDQLRRQMERLEIHLTTWLRKTDAAPTLSLVGTGREVE